MTRGVCIGRSLDLLDDGHQKKPCVKSISALRKYQGRVRLQPYRRKPVGSLLVVLLLESGALPLRGLLGGKGSTSRAGLCSQSPPTHVMKCDVSGGIPGTSVQHSEMFSNRPEITSQQTVTSQKNLRPPLRWPLLQSSATVDNLRNLFFNANV